MSNASVSWREISLRLLMSGRCRSKGGIALSDVVFVLWISLGARLTIPGDWFLCSDSSTARVCLCMTHGGWKP